MSGKNLTFKLVLDADNKGLVSTAKNSETVMKAVFDSIRSESDKLKQATESASKEIGNIVPKGTSELADKLTQSLTSATGIIKDAGDNAKSTAGNFTDFGNKAEKALSQLKTDLTQAKQKLQEFSATNASPADIEKAKVQVDQLEKEVQQADQAFNNFQGEVGRANTSLKNTDTAAQTAQKGLNGAKFAVTALVGAMGALGVGLGIRELAQAADSYTNLSARINIATKDGGNFKSAMAGVHQIALMTNSSLDATGDLFSRLNAVGKDMGMTQQNSLDLTKTINQAIQTSGASAQASEAFTAQFIQSMQQGTLRGEEYNSMMENGYGVAEALARGLGVTTGELKKMADNGELGAERVYKALLSQKDAVQQTFDQFPTTISNALQKISTSWQILIGEMDQANGSSATVANALSVIADNLGILKLFFDDVAAGVGWFQDKLSEIDPSTIESIQSTLSAVYDTIKTVISSLAGMAETGWSAFSSVLDAIAPLFNAILNGKEEVSGITTLFNVFKIALGVVSDAATGLNIALKLLLAGIQFISGGIHALSASVLDFFGFDDLAAQAQNASDALFRQAEKNASEANRLALESKSATREAIREIRQTEEEANQERIADSQKTLDELKAKEEKHKADYKAISDERIQLEQQLFDARKTGNQASIDLATKGLAELDAKEKAYQAESQKITDAKIQAAQTVANAMIQSADAAGMAQLKVLNAQLAAQGLQAEFDSTGKVVVKAMQEAVVATEGQSNATDKARKAAAALGIDLDVSLNRVSEKFKAGETNVNSFVAGLEGLGVTGKQAGEVTYEAWQKWTEEAKSQAEIDLAKKGLVEFGNQGVFSAKQVEMGMRYLDEVNGKLPKNISEVEKAYRLLGITSREEAGKMADAQMKAFNVMQNSGTASAEQIKQALINMADKIYASGDAVKIALYESKLGASGLATQVDETGKKSVKAMSDIEQSIHRTRSATDGAKDGFRSLGQVAREEAQSVKSEWEQAIDAAQASTDKFRAEMKRQGESLSKGIYDYDSYSKADVLSQLKSKGYSDKEAEKLAGSIWSEAMSADRAAKEQGLGKDGSLAVKALINAEYNNAASKGLTTQHGTNKINELMRQMTASNLVSTGPSTKPVDVNSLAPNVSMPIASPATTNASKDVNYNISFGGQTLSLSGSAEQESAMNQLIKQLKTQAKST
ncbi:tape measure protein [Acinetobacter sp. ANC 4862]|uniref:tape measure protein n=1 Tax=Acinetobacter sp. ANC 4862 TaxID=2529849 RepID=UPI00103DEC7B|nr:tape measure protein [Acinetobacter sp. ANC 4862]TCH64201.1 tape measure domain-containing protein [Acinetobacter sp. ANC 4862]